MHHTSPITIVSGPHPGMLGRIAAWHGSYYARHWGLSAAFEIEVARECADFLEYFQPGRDLVLLARDGEELIGSVVIDGRNGAGEARLRWFIVDSRYTGHGLGRRLLAEALAFCRLAGYGRVSLWTFAGLDAARRLYDRAGFRLAEEAPYDGWGSPVLRQKLILELRP